MANKLSRIPPNGARPLSVLAGFGATGLAVVGLLPYVGNLFSLGGLVLGVGGLALASRGRERGEHNYAGWVLNGAGAALALADLVGIIS